MGATKNRQSIEQIKKIVTGTFRNRQVRTVVELTEGLCNAAYLITFTDEDKVILKIAPKDPHHLLTNEMNMMQAEVEAMHIIKEKTDIPVAKVYGYDDTCTLCDSTYFFMEYMSGTSYFSEKSRLHKEAIERIDYQIGKIERKITSIEGQQFGLLGDHKHWVKDLFDMVYLLITRVLEDAEAKYVEIGYQKEFILAELMKDRASFDEVKQPTLVHWDLWEGNVLIKEEHVVAIIDWERAMWGEPLMDDRFRSHTRSKSFLRGFGKTSFSRSEWQRIYWYDVFLYLTMMTEGVYREYEDDSQYQWVKPLFEASFKALRERAK